MKTYDELDIYEASFDEVKQAVKQQYKNREIESASWTREKMTVGDWKNINKEYKDSLKKMEVKYSDVFYNPNNMRVYIKQKVWIEKLNIWNGLSKVDKEETLEMFNGDRKQARAYWNDEVMCSSMEYSIRTNTDYYCGEDEEYFTVPAW